MLTFILVTDAARCEQWVKACNNPRVHARNKSEVHKVFRICRRHFDSSCMNGACRRLLNTAVPTLHLNLDLKPSMLTDNDSFMDHEDSENVVGEQYEYSVVDGE